MSMHKIQKLKCRKERKQLKNYESNLPYTWFPHNHWTVHCTLHMIVSHGYYGNSFHLVTPDLCDTMTSGNLVVSGNSLSLHESCSPLKDIKMWQLRCMYSNISNVHVLILDTSFRLISITLKYAEHFLTMLVSLSYHILFSLKSMDFILIFLVKTIKKCFHRTITSYRSQGAPILWFIWPPTILSGF